MAAFGQYCTVGLVVGVYYYFQARRDAKSGMDIAKAVVAMGPILITACAFLWPVMLVVDFRSYIEHKRQMRKIKKAIVEAIEECPEGGSVVFEKGRRHHG